MTQFSRTTLYEAYQVLRSRIDTHNKFADLMYGLGLDNLVAGTGGGLHGRFLRVFKHLKDNRDATWNGRSVGDMFVEQALRHSRASDEAFFRALERDGFTLDENGVLRRTLPEEIDLPAADNEVNVLLDRHGLAIPKGHLDQGIQAHSQGNWAAANSQFRTFLESLFDEIALLIDPGSASVTKPGDERRRLLAKLPEPFLSGELNEWSDDRKSFVNGVFKRLHPHGSHPGLSDEEDSTFRLHLVLLTARLFLRRLDSRVRRVP